MAPQGWGPGCQSKSPLCPSRSHCCRTSNRKVVSTYYSHLVISRRKKQFDLNLEEKNPPMKKKIRQWKKSHLSLAPSFQKRSQPSSSISCHLFTFICKQCLVNWALTWLCFCLYQLLKGDSLSQDLHQPLLVLPWPPSPPSRARRSRSTCLQHPLSERDQCILSTNRAYLGFHLGSIFATTLVCFASFFLGRFAFGLYILVWSAAWGEGHSEQIVQQTEQSVSVCWQISDRHTDQWGNYPADYVDNEKMLNHVMINDMVMFQSMSITVVIISSINKILIVISSHLVALLRDIAKYHMLN